MVYHLEISKRARRNLKAIALAINAESTPAASLWFERLENAILFLQHTPHAHPVTHENPLMRQLIFGNKPHFYRVVYKVDDLAHRVIIVHVRHGRRDR